MIEAPAPQPTVGRAYTPVPAQPKLFESYIRKPQDWRRRSVAIRPFDRFLSGVPAPHRVVLSQRADRVTIGADGHPARGRDALDPLREPGREVIVLAPAVDPAVLCHRTSQRPFNREVDDPPARLVGRRVVGVLGTTADEGHNGPEQREVPEHGGSRVGEASGRTVTNGLSKVNSGFLGAWELGRRRWALGVVAGIGGAAETLADFEQPHRRQQTRPRLRGL